MRLMGPITARAGPRSMPRESNQPPGVQKSFCMSITTSAARAASNTRGVGSAAMRTGRARRRFPIKFATPMRVSIAEWSSP